MNLAVRTTQHHPVDYTNCFQDVRLEVRGNDLAAEMLQKETVILNRLAENRADLVGSCRFFRNPRVSLDALRDEATARCAEAVHGRQVLAIQDTSEINYQTHAAKLRRDDPDVGPVGNNTESGFFLHPMLVVDAEDGFPLGVSDLFIWNRTWEHPTKDARKYKTLPIEQKESFRWISSGQASKAVLSEAAHVTIIADREADMYEECVALPDERTHLLIRSLHNRCLLDQKETLFEHVGNQPVRGTYTLDIPTGHSKRQARTATIEVRWIAVNLVRPQHASKRALPDSVQVVAIEARELSSSVPSGEAPILWRLLTTHAVTSFAEALQQIQWYRWRWFIEQLFRTLKHQGLDVEASQLENGAALKKLVSMAVSTAIRILQLTLERDATSGRPATMAFSREEIDCLQRVQHVYEGSTVQQKNPFPVFSLAWAAWIIGRIGGWKGYKNADPAGPITIKRGVEIFSQIFTGWQIQKICA